MRHQPILTGRVLGYRAVQVLEYVRRSVTDEGRVPSYGMICDELGIATRGEVHRIVMSLERRKLLGLIEFGKCRWAGRGQRIGCRLRLPA